MNDQTPGTEHVTQASPTVPSAIARHLMPLKAVRIDALDEFGDAVIVPPENGKGGGPVVASGFFMREQSGLYLYTCWHVVTGITLGRPVLPGSKTKQRRMKLRISMQASEQHNQVVVSIGGMHLIDVDLYDMSAYPRIPIWEQDERSIPNANLSMAGLTQPFWHDVARVRMPDTFRLPDIQVSSRGDLWPHLIAPGDPLLLVGYPYGYSAVELSPTAIVLKRSVAAIAKNGPGQQISIDGSGAPGMSGGPVLCESSDRLFLFGLYTGVIYPDGAPEVLPDRTTALGTVCPLNLLYLLKLARPSPSVPDLP